MATSSITKNFVVYGEKQAEIFANAIEESANTVTTPIKVSVDKISGPEEYLAESKDAEIGEDVLLRIFSDFSCPINPDVEQFLKERAIEFTKKNQSVTYLVISSDDGELLGYFTIAVKPITVNADNFSGTVRRKISRVSELDEASHSYNLSAYLIAQIGKNYTEGLNNRITGKELLELAID